MATSLLRKLAVCMAAIALVSCKTVPLRNKPLDQFSATAGYRYENIEAGPNNSDSMLVILTFSGGGTRAAALCYGVLEKLRDTEIVWEGSKRRLLDEVDVISSVSGGSLPAAYFALFGDRIFEDFPEKVLYRDIQGGLVKQVLSVRNWSRLVSPFYGRTDTLADDFSRQIFDNARFRDLVAQGRRPFVVINATDISLGSRFDFTQRQFDLLYSDLSAYPVGHAVAASAAFPGLLTPMVLRNYEKRGDFVAPAWISDELILQNMDGYRLREAQNAQSYIDEGRPYIHLCDGGVSDNLGVLSVIQLLADVFPGDNTNGRLTDGTVKKLVIITVNARCVDSVDWNQKATILNAFKVLNVAGSAPLGNFSEAELVLLRLILKQISDKQELRRQLAPVIGEDAVRDQFPLLAGPDFDCHFIEVEFDRIENEQERAYLNAIPTAFKLKHEQVDHLLKAAPAILEKHAAFQQLIEGLK